MSLFVVDASVVIKWFVPEVHSDAACRLLEQDHEYLAPDLLFAEATNVIWKKVGRGELSSGQGQRLVRDLGMIAVETVPCRPLANDAFSLATATGCSVYDALYLTLALHLDTQMITADRRLAIAFAAIPTTAPHILTLQDFNVS